MVNLLPGKYTTVYRGKNTANSSKTQFTVVKTGVILIKNNGISN